MSDASGSLDLDKHNLRKLPTRHRNQRANAAEDLATLLRAVEQNPATVVITDANGIIEYVNPKFFELTGYTVEEARGKNPRFLKSGSHPDSFYEAMWATLLSGNVWHGEIRNKRKNGELYWELDCISPVRDALGDITHFVAIKEDITDRKQAALELEKTETALRRSENRFRTLSESLPIGILEADIDGSCTYTNLHWQEISGLTFEQSLGSGWSIAVHPEDRERVLAEWRKQVTLSSEAFLEYRIVNRGDQRTRWVQTRVRPVKGVGDAVTGWVGSVDDITQVKEMQEALRESERCQKAILDNIPDPAWLKDRQGRILAVNFAWSEFTGVPQEEALGKTSAEIFPPSVAEKLLAEDEHVMVSGGQFRHDEKMVAGKRISAWFESFKTALVDGEGNCYGMAGIARNISRRKLAEDSIRLERDFSNNALDSLPGVFYVLNREGKFLRWNINFERLSGYSAVELGRMDAFDFFEEPDLSVVRAKFQEAFTFGITHVEANFAAKDGTRHCYYYTARVFHIDGEPCLIGMGIDIQRRKQVEVALRESQERYRALFDRSLDCVFVNDFEGKFLDANPAAFNLLGYCKEELSSLSFASLLIPEQLPKALDAIAEVRATGTQKDLMEFTVRRKDGSLVDIETKSSLVMRDGIPFCIQGIARDVTQRKRNEAAVRESQSFLESTLDALSAHIAILDEKGVIIAVNAAWSDFARENALLARDYGIGSNYIEIFRGVTGDQAKDGLKVADGIRAVMVGRQDQFAMEYPCHSENERRWFAVRVTRFKGDGPIRVVVAHENISARKRAEEDLQRKTAFLEGQVSASIDGILVVDEAGRKALQNQRLTDLMRIPQETTENENNEEQLTWVTGAVKDSEQFLKKVQFLSSNPGVVSRDEIEMKDGTVLDRYSAPMVGQDGKYYGRIWTFRDITERRQAAKQLELARDAAESANRAKSEFLATMSHEIRTPMNGLLGFTSLLRETPLSDEQRMFVETIEVSGMKLLTLINDILDFSKIEAGRVSLESIRFTLDDVIQEVVELLAPQAEQKKLLLKTYCDAQVPKDLLGDPTRVRQVLLNLAGNALKFTKEGCVAIRVGIAKSKPGFVKIEIVDSGIGISLENQALLFKKFTQVDSTTTRQFGGTGLGLAISKRLVELMEGEIGVVSDVGRGSTFWFTLPLKVDLAPSISVFGNEHCSSAARVHPAFGAREARSRILLVEDDPTNQQLAAHMLEKLGCQVVLATNGKEAVAKAGVGAYDAILMDCLMPELDGWEATKQIRLAEKGRRHVPIIAITASIIGESRQKCLDAGMDDYLEKPVCNHALQSALAKWTSNASERLRENETDSIHYEDVGY